MTKARAPIASKETSIKRGLDFIYRVAGTPDGFDSYGKLLICCFALMGATSRDPSLRRLARLRAQKLAQRWGRVHPVVPPDATADLVLAFGLVRSALSRVRVRDVVVNAQLLAAANRLPAPYLRGL